MLENLQKKVVEIVKEESTNESIRKRLKWSTVTKAAGIIRGVSGTISALALAASKMPVKIPQRTEDWLEWISSITAIIAFGAHLNKGKK